MLTTTETLLEQGFGGQVFKESDFACLFKGSKARRYALIHKALKKGELSRLSRGFYILGSKYRPLNISKFFIASSMVSGSFISFETALSFHGWIPEKVTVIRSVISKGRTRSFNSPIGEFEYIKIPVNEYEFLSGVYRKEVNGKPFLMAGPLRALADYVYLRKMEWSGLGLLQDGMRIEMDSLKLLTDEDFKEILRVYSSKRVLSFLNHMRKALRPS